LNDAPPVIDEKSFSSLPLNVAETEADLPEAVKVTTASLPQ